ncbi:ABC transporter [Phytophthora megakarya]|uniref:ABC transporter n=1 Tax=Phytophthora megakarya TaxID=4795 RepID=A0A225W3F3_9STRA|nr:ABC transporter [Phytophthora megakarya]
MLFLLLLASLSATALSAPCDPLYEQRSSSGDCVCRDGFSGFGCRMCSANGSLASSDVCSTTFGSDFSCVTGLRYDAHATLKTYGCTLSADLQALFPDGALDVRCDRDAQGVANCTAAVFKAKETVRSVHVIDCNITQCAFATGDANGECVQIDCKCGPQCSAMTKALVETSLSGKPAKIEVTNTTHLAIVIEGSPIPLSATCTASACERIGGGGSSGSGSSGGDSDGISGLWVAVAACAAFAATLLLCASACSCCLTASIRRGQEDVETEVLKFTSRSVDMLEFRHVSCYAESGQSSEPKRILHKISGSASRGEVLGLLGPSGSGKTTLLNALAAVENGRSQFTGELSLDGKRLSKGYRRIAAYVQQDDSLYSTLTVRECISYSAQLRLPATLSDKMKDSMVDRVITELNLNHVVNSRIGSVGGNSGQRGVSGGERRRVSIGMELVTSPQILILDEPTSGLDSSSAHSVVQLVKDLAGHGRIVVLSIHQPSARSFLLLDKIMLLGKGKLLYSGSPAESKNFFHSLGFKCPANENIADFILDIASDTNNIPMVRSHMRREPSPVASKPSFLSSSSRIRLQNIAPQYFIRSPTSRAESSPFMKEDLSLNTPRLENVLASPVSAGTPTEPSTFEIPVAPGTPRNPPPQSMEQTETDEIIDLKIPLRSILVEIRVLFARTAQNILRHRSLLVLHIALGLSLALFGGLIFNDVTNDLAGFQNRMGAFYFILTFFGFASMSSMDLFIGERRIFLRETGAMYYGAFSYFLAKATLDTLLLRVLPASLFASIFYWIMGLQATTGRFMLFSLTLVLFNVAAGAICLLVGVLSRRVGSANLGATVILLVMLLFGGFLLNSHTMPMSVGWLKHLSIFSYAFEILMTNELKGLILKFDAPGYPAVPVYGEVYLKTLGMDYANRYYDVAALALIAASLQVLAFLFLSLQVPLHRGMIDVDEDEEFATPPCNEEV